MWGRQKCLLLGIAAFVTATVRHYMKDLSMHGVTVAVEGNKSTRVFLVSSILGLSELEVPALCSLSPDQSFFSQCPAAFECMWSVIDVFVCCVNHRSSRVGRNLTRIIESNSWLHTRLPKVQTTLNFSRPGACWKHFCLLWGLFYFHLMPWLLHWK